MLTRHAALAIGMERQPHRLPLIIFLFISFNYLLMGWPRIGQYLRLVLIWSFHEKNLCQEHHIKNLETDKNCRQHNQR